MRSLDERESELQHHVAEFCSVGVVPFKGSSTVNNHSAVHCRNSERLKALLLANFRHQDAWNIMRKEREYETVTKPNLTAAQPKEPHRCIAAWNRAIPTLTLRKLPNDAMCDAK